MCCGSKGAHLVFNTFLFVLTPDLFKYGSSFLGFIFQYNQKVEKFRVFVCMKFLLICGNS